MKSTQCYKNWWILYSSCVYSRVKEKMLELQLKHCMKLEFSNAKEARDSSIRNNDVLYRLYPTELK